MTCCPTCGQPVTFGPLAIDLNSGWATSGEWRRHIPPREAELLFALLERAPATVPNNHLVSRLYGICEPAHARTNVTSFVRRLRKWITGSGYEIENAYGYGYALRRV